MRFALLSRTFAPALVALVSLGTASLHAVEPQDVPAKAESSADVTPMDSLAKGKDAKGRHTHKKHHKHHKGAAKHDKSADVK